MSSKENPIRTEEPAAGWLRFEVEGEKPWYKTPVPRTVIRDASKLQDYLEKEHGFGRMIDIDVTMFSFKRRLGLRKKTNSSASGADMTETIDTGDSETCDEVDVDIKSLSIVERLTRNTEVMDHRKLLSKSSKMLDNFRLSDGFQTPDKFEDLKKEVSSLSDLREMLKVLNTETPVVDSINLIFSDTCLAEVSSIDTKMGPLVDFPPSINENIYCQTVEFAVKVCPTLTHFVTNMVVRRGEPILPSDVLKVAMLLL